MARIQVVAARRIPFEPVTTIFRLLSKIHFEHLADMVVVTSRKDTLASYCGAVALGLCFAGAARSPAGAQSIGSAYTDFDTRMCSPRRRRAGAGRET
jgi:hypothetical protein